MWLNFFFSDSAANFFKYPVCLVFTRILRVSNINIEEVLSNSAVEIYLENNYSFKIDDVLLHQTRIRKFLNFQIKLIYFHTRESIKFWYLSESAKNCLYFMVEYILSNSANDILNFLLLGYSSQKFRLYRRLGFL